MTVEEFFFYIHIYVSAVGYSKCNSGYLHISDSMPSIISPLPRFRAGPYNFTVPSGEDQYFVTNFAVLGVLRQRRQRREGSEVVKEGP